MRTNQGLSRELGGLRMTLAKMLLVLIIIIKWTLIDCQHYNCHHYPHNQYYQNPNNDHDHLNNGHQNQYQCHQDLVEFQCFLHLHTAQVGDGPEYRSLLGSLKNTAAGNNVEDLEEVKLFLFRSS